MISSSPSYSGLTEVEGGTDGTTIYIDFDSIKEVNGLIYFWELIDYLKMGKDVGKIRNPKNPKWMSITYSIKRYNTVCNY